MNTLETNESGSEQSIERLTLDLDKEVANLLDRMAARKGLPKAQVLRQAFRRSSLVDTILTDPDRKLLVVEEGGDKFRIVDLPERDWSNRPREGLVRVDIGSKSGSADIAGFLREQTVKKDMLPGQIVDQALRRSSWIDTLLADPGRILKIGYPDGSEEVVIDDLGLSRVIF